MDEQEQAAHGDAGARMGELAAEGSLTRAAAPSLAGPSTTKRSPWPRTRAIEAAARYVPNLLNLLPQWGQFDGPTPDDPAVLGAVSTPVLVLHGSGTKPFLIASARYVADHVPNSRVQAIPGAGHAAPLTHPEALAEALTEFFASSPEVQLQR